MGCGCTASEAPAPVAGCDRTRAGLVVTESGLSRSAWVEPGAHIVAEGVYRIPLPLPTDGLRAVNVYALRHQDGVALIDGGWALEVSEQALIDALGMIECELGDITRFLVTHAHRDHYTQAQAIRRRLGPRVALGWDERDSIRSIAARAQDPASAGPFPQVALLRRADDPKLADLLAGIRPEGLRPDDWADPDDWLRDGDRLWVGDRCLQVIASPGHTRGHVVFADDDHGLLFAGDHVLPHITPSIGYEEVLVASPLADYLRSLHLMRERPDARLLPAHGPVGMDVHERIDELLEHHRLRLDECLRAVSRGATSAREVAESLRWTRRATPLGDLDWFNRMMAVLETHAHLVVLVERGWTTVEQVGGVDRFHVADAAIGSVAEDG